MFFTIEVTLFAKKKAFNFTNVLLVKNTSYGKEYNLYPWSYEPFLGTRVQCSLDQQFLRSCWRLKPLKLLRKLFASTDKSTMKLKFRTQIAKKKICAHILLINGKEYFGV